jgi:hypothetical protein
MAAKIFPAGITPLVTNSIDFTKEGGEVVSYVHQGDTDNVLVDYNTFKSAMIASTVTDLSSLSFQSINGRATLIRRYVRENKDIEELYGVDVIKDICTAKYFDDMTDTQIVAVRTKHENGEARDEAWTVLQKNLYWHLVRGMESYLETQFILRVTTRSASATTTKKSFTGINTVVTAPTLSANMQQLIDSLPAGEWLKKPPTAENLGKGRWRLGQEYHWAEKWSVLYGGTWGIAT